jgi:hypothetical protein
VPCKAYEKGGIVAKPRIFKVLNVNQKCNRKYIGKVVKQLKHRKHGYDSYYNRVDGFLVYRVKMPDGEWLPIKVEHLLDITDSPLYRALND